MLFCKNMKSRWSHIPTIKKLNTKKQNREGRILQNSERFDDFRSELKEDYGHQMTTQTLNLNCVVFPIMLGHVLIEDAVKSNMATTAVAWHDPGCAKVVGNVSLRARSSLFDVFRSTGELKNDSLCF